MDKIFEGELFLFRQTQPENISVFLKDEKVIMTKDGKKMSFRNDENGYYQNNFNGDRFSKYFADFPDTVLHGFIKGDLFVCSDVIYTEGEKQTRMHFEFYHRLLAEYNINYRMPECKIFNADDILLRTVMNYDPNALWHLKNYAQQIFEDARLK